MKRRGLESNIWKYFFLLFTARRNFTPILSIYYLSLPNTQAQQIGFYTAAGYIASLVMMIPAGYLGDRRGNKNVIILAKIFFLISSSLFFFGTNFRFFVFAAIFQSLAMDAFSTGNLSAFLHDTLCRLKRESEYKKVASRLRGWVSLVSVGFLIGLPFLTAINIKLPFAVAIVIDIIGVLFALSLFPVRGKTLTTQTSIQIKKIRPIIKESTKTGFISMAIFSSLIMAFLLVDSSFRYPYLQSLGYPVMFIGLVMGGSRLVRFLVSRYAYNIEKWIPFSKLMLIEIFLFAGYYLTVSTFQNPYVNGVIFSLVIGYFRGRSELYTNHLIRLIPNNAYKTTLLSVQGQILGIFQIALIFIAGFLMQKSYHLGFSVMGIALFIILGTYYFFIPKRTKNMVDETLYTKEKIINQDSDM